MYRLQLILLGGIGVVLVTAIGYLRALPTYTGKVINCKDTNPCKDSNAQVVGWNPGAGKGFSSLNISIKLYLCDHLISEFVHKLSGDVTYVKSL